MGALLFVIWITLRASLPTLDGSNPLSGLSTPVLIDRDAAGVPTLTAGNRTDLARALGYVHAQDRYFEMDLLRRAAAGELSALLGPSQLAVDRQLRAHRFRSVARAVVDALEPRERAVLDAYVAGVNAGLASLRSRPFEYWLLRSEPSPWTDEDSILCVHAMYLQLQDAQGHRQLQRGLLRAMLPDAAWRFVEAGAPEWEATVDGTQIAEPAHSYDLPSSICDGICRGRSPLFHSPGRASIPVATTGPLRVHARQRAPPSLQTICICRFVCRPSGTARA